MHHPNIVQLFGFTCDASISSEEKWYLVYEFCALTLEEVLWPPHKSGRCPPETWTRLDLVRQLANAMRFLHSRNIAHRDLKVQNLLIKMCATTPTRGARILADADAYQLKVCDFGMARSSDEKHRSSILRGTPSYMAPEIIRNESHDSKKSDVFAFAICAHVMLTCQRPHCNMTAVEVMRRVKDEALRPSSDDVAIAGMRPILEACWAEAENDRPPFEDIVKRLAALCEATPE